MCHKRAPTRALLHLTPLLLALLFVACAPRSGWQRTAARACEPREPARVCLIADPDRPLTLSVGDARIIPGECAQAPRGGGLLRVDLHDGRDHRHKRRTLRARRGHTQRFEADAALRLRLRQRQRCDRRAAEVSTSGDGC
ncbi:MAG: hypothetical protein IPK80_30870 [Nannocystis sp.]|nr:hypothetical protein [Nannocystis sp.]